MNCELCDLVAGDIKTRLYYRNGVVTIVDCDHCQIPMLVFSHHGNASEEEREQALRTINRLFEYESIRSQGRKIPTEIHEHYHILGAQYLGGENG